MSLSDKTIKEFQEITKKETGKDISWEEASDGAYNLAGLAELAFNFYREDQRQQKKLEESPKGFHLKGNGYTCFICGDSVSNEETWYDKYGIKCLVCQKAIDKKIIPATAAKNKDSWYSKFDLESSFNIDRHALNRFMKQGILKPRIVLNSAGRPHAYLFLIKDNEDILPPKKLTESKMVKETKDGKDCFHLEPWYRFVNPREHLKGYKIMDYLKVTHEEKKKDVIKETKNENMKLKDLFKIGGIMQSFDWRSDHLDHNNCVIHSKSKSEDFVILHLKRESDGEEGNVYLRVQDKYKSMKDQLLNWAFTSSSIMGLTLNQLESLDTNLTIEDSNGKLFLHQK